MTEDTRRSVRLLLFLALAAPLVWARGFLFPYVAPKAFFFQSVVALALLASALGWMWGGGGDDPSPGGGGRGLRGDRVLWALAALVAVAGVTAALGAAPARSWLGTLERRWGVLTWALLLAFYGLLRVRLDDGGWRRALGVTVLVATAVAAVGLVGHHGLLDGGPGADAPWRRVSATLGNAGYLGAYLLLTATAAAYLAWSAGPALHRVGWGLAGALQAYVLLLSGTRSPVLGLAVGVAVVATGALVWSADRRVRAAAAAAAGIVIVAVAAVAAWAAPAEGVAAGWAERLGSLSADAASMQNRFSVWEAALAGFLDDPLTGAGPGNFHLVWSRHFDPLVYHRLSGTTGFDRAHDVLAESAATMGVPGLLAYVGLLAAAGWTLVRAWRRGGLTGPATAILGVGLAAYVVHLLLWFEDHASFVVFLTLVGFVAHRASSGPDEGPEDRPAGDGPAGPAASFPARASLAVGLLALAAVAAWHNARALAAARDTWRGEMALDDWEGARAFRTALARDVPGSGPIVRLYLRRLTYLARFGDEGSPEGPSPRMEAALRAGERAVAAWAARDPTNPRVHVQRARLCGIRARVRGEAAPDDACAARSLERAIELAPARLRYRHLLARHYLSAGRPERAREVLEVALAVYGSFGETYYYLARAAWDAGDRGEAARWSRIAVSLGYEGQAPAFLLELAGWLEERGRAAEAADLVESHLALRYRDLARSGAVVPAGAGFRPWDLHLASRLPLLHWRAGRPDDALRTARFLAHRLVAPGDARSEERFGVPLEAFLRDVEAGRRARWSGAEGVLDGFGAAGDDAPVTRPSEAAADEDDRAEDAGGRTVDAGRGPGEPGDHPRRAPGGDGRAGSGGGDRVAGAVASPGEHRPRTGGIGLPRPAGPGQDAGHRPAGRGPDPRDGGRGADAGGARRPHRQPDEPAGRTLPDGLRPSPPRHAALQRPRPGGPRQPLPVPRREGGADREQLPGAPADRAVRGPVSRRAAALFSNGVHPLRGTRRQPKG